MPSREYDLIADMIANATQRAHLEQAARRMFAASKAGRLPGEEFNRLGALRSARLRELLGVPDGA